MDLLASLAIVKVNFDHDHDYINDFVPFVAECLQIATAPDLSVTDIRQAITERFGLEMPDGALTTILGRMAHKGYVRRTNNRYSKLAKLDELDFTDRVGDVLRIYNAAIERLKAFAKDRQQLDLSDQAAQDALLDFLSTWSSEVLSAKYRGNTVGTHDGDKSEFLVARFIEDVLASDPQTAAFLDTLVKGTMLTDVLYLPDLGTVRRRFNDVGLYLDTPFVLRLLGYAGPELAHPCQELVDLVLREHATLYVFDFTLREVEGILDASAHALRDPNREPSSSEVFQWFLTKGASPSDVAWERDQMPTRLRSYQVRVVASPEYEPDLVIDEPALHNILEGMHYRNPQALEHDLKALAAMHRLRRGRGFSHIEDCKAMWVTTNETLIHLANRFFGQLYAPQSVPCAISDTALGTIAWLKRPQDKAASDFQRKRVIAYCYAALNPSEQLWRAYAAEIDRLKAQGEVTAEQAVFLRYGESARRALMDLTYGEPSRVGGSTILDILRTSAENTAAAIASAKATGVEEGRLAELGVTEGERDRRVWTEGQLQKRLDLLRLRSARVGTWLSRIVGGVAAVILIGAMAETVATALRGSNSPVTWVAWLALILLELVTLYQLWFGRSVRDWLKSLEQWAGRTFLNWLGGEPTEEA